MKTKNYKIRIKKDVIIKKNKLEVLKEDNVQDFTKETSDIISAVADEAKMIGKTLQRFFFSYKHGIESLYFIFKNDQERLAEINESFLRRDERLKADQNALLNKQLGYADLQKFLLMTSPGFVLFDKFSDINKADIYDKIERMKNQKEQRKRKYRSLASYYNFLNRFCKFVDSSFTEVIISDEDAANGNFPTGLDRKITNTFRSNADAKTYISIIASLYKDNNTNPGYTYVIKGQISISSRFYSVLRLLHEDIDKNHNEIKKKLRESYDIESKFISLSGLFGDANFQSDITTDFGNFAYSGNLAENKNAYKNLILKIKNSSLILEEEESSKDLKIQDEKKNEDEGSEDEAELKALEEVFNSVRNSSEICILAYTMYRSILWTSCFANILERLKSLENTKKNHLNDLNEKHKIDITGSDEYEEISEKNSQNISALNKDIETFNRLFNDKVGNIDIEKAKKASSEYQEGGIKINQAIEEYSKERKETLKDSENAEVLLAACEFAMSIQVMLDIISESSIKDLTETTKSIKNLFDKYTSSIEEDLKYLNTKKSSKLINKLLDKHADTLKQNNLDISLDRILEIENNFNKSKSAYNDLQGINNDIIKFSQKKTELESKLAKNIEIINNNSSEQSESQDNENKVSEEKFTEITYINDKVESEK